MNWKEAKILFKFPARHRKDKLFSTLEKYYSMMVNKEDFHFLISIDQDDQLLNTPEVTEKLAGYKNLTCVVGESKGKIGACNRDINDFSQTWDIVVLVSDDMIPKITGYDMMIRKDLCKAFADLDGVMWYNDGHKGDELNTLCILGRKYYDRFGYIYHPSYISLYCDNEFMEVSKLLNRVKYSNMVIIEHQHWAWGYGEMDPLYQENEKFIGEDGDNFLKRKKENFGL